MSRRSAAALLALLSALGGCELFSGPDAEDRLTTARRRWLTQGPYSYNYEVRRDCFCPNAGRWARVEVEEGRVAAAVWLDSGSAVEPQWLAALPTVPTLFDDIERAIAQHAVLLETRYDPTDGHPIRINVDVSHNILDEEFAVDTRNLQTPLTAAGSEAR